MIFKSKTYSFGIKVRYGQRKKVTISRDLWWEQRESNPRPSACKADALNQLSYAPELGMQIYDDFLKVQILFKKDSLQARNDSFSLYLQTDSMGMFWF